MTHKALHPLAVAWRCLLSESFMITIFIIINARPFVNLLIGREGQEACLNLDDRILAAKRIRDLSIGLRVILPAAAVQ